MLPPDFSQERNLDGDLNCYLKLEKQSFFFARELLVRNLYLCLFTCSSLYPEIFHINILTW